MLFHSFEFFILFSVSLVGNYYISNNRYRILFLLFLCAIFYLYSNLFNGIYIAASILITYYTAIKMTESERPNLWFYASILFNAGMLIAFKTFDLYLPYIRNFIPKDTNINMALPLGISFYIFQAISYTVDVKRKTFPAEKDFPTYALYIAYFPNLVAGPIERARSLIPQFNIIPKIDYEKFRSGALLFLLGLIKKLIIADRMEGVGNLILTHWENLSPLSILIGGYAVAFQYYFDFSAYSEMALGLGRMSGIELTRNFKAPLWSASPLEFWKRWHISLMNWLLDYVFTPILKLDLTFMNGLAGSFLIFLMVGAWHGVTLNFAVWGIVNACVVGLNMYWRKRFGKKSNSFFKPFKIFLTFHYFVLNGLFVYFPKVSTALSVLKKGFFWRNLSSECGRVLVKNNIQTCAAKHLDFSYILKEIPVIDKTVIVTVVPVILLGELIFTKYEFMPFYQKVPLAARWIFYTIAMICLILYSNSGIKPYVYVRF